MRTPADDATAVDELVAAAPPTSPRPYVLALVTTAVALGLGTLVVVLFRYGADWPAQAFRADLAQHGLSVWTNAWYGGDALPGYSVLYPPLAAVLGSSALGVLATGAAAGFAALLAPTGRRGSGPAFCASVVLCLIECLLIGQVPFLTGVALAAAALVALRAERPGWTALAAALSSLVSPLAALFLLLGGAALVRSTGRRRLLPLLPALLGSIVAAVVDSGGGPFTYHFVTLVAITTFCAVVLVLTDRYDRGLRDFAYLYFAVAAVAFVVDNPVGANLNRLGRLVGLPLAVYYLGRRTLPRWRRAGTLLAVGLATWWSLLPFVTAVQWGVHDPGRHASYYRGLLGYLATRNAADSRLEIPFTRTHTETFRVARAFPLARGWERQVDLAQNDVLYHPLTAAAYRQWLADNAVSLVALSTLEPDVGGRPETVLLRQPPSYLRPVWHDAHWRVWRVVDPQPLADGPARVTDLGPASVQLHFARPGTSLLRVRSSPLWQVTDGRATLRRAEQGWLRVRSERAGDVTLRARLTFALLDPTNGLR